MDSPGLGSKFTNNLRKSEEGERGLKKLLVPVVPNCKIKSLASLSPNILPEKHISNKTTDFEDVEVKSFC